MPEIELIEVIEAILMWIAIQIFLFVCRKRRDLFKWLPAFGVFGLAFLCTNFEALAYPDLFNNLEQVFYMLGGVLMLVAVGIDFVKTFIAPKDSEPKIMTIPKKRQ
jgi:amino acid transporter